MVVVIMRQFLKTDFCSGMLNRLIVMYTLMSDISNLFVCILYYLVSFICYICVVRSFVLCGQGSSLLWTPVLRPLYRSNAPAQGEEECAVYVYRCVGWRKEQ